MPVPLRETTFFGSGSQHPGSPETTFFDSQPTPASPDSPSIENTDSDLEIAEITINEAFEKDVRINFANFFSMKSGDCFQEFADLETLWKISNKHPFHKPIPSGVELSIPYHTLANIFGADAKFLSFITNEDMEYFRVSAMKKFNISYCSCGCTWITLSKNRHHGSYGDWLKTRSAVAELICNNSLTESPLSVQTRRRLQAMAHLAEIEREEEQALEQDRKRALGLVNPSRPINLVPGEGQQIQEDENANHPINLVLREGPKTPETEAPETPVTETPETEAMDANESYLKEKFIIDSQAF